MPRLPSHALRSSRLPAALLALLALLAPGVAAAEVGVADFAPTHTQQLVGLDDFTFDTDWFPMDQPVQLRLIVHGGNSVQIDMPGAGLYDWGLGALHFEGETDAGRFGVDVGFTLDARVRFDVFGLQWESDIIGPYDYAVISEDSFTPYLLPGNPERPLLIADQTDPVTLVSVPITPDIVVAAGNLDIDVFIIVEASLAGQAIEASAADPQQQVLVTGEGEAVPFLAGPGPLPDPLIVDGILVCDLATAPTVVLRPTLVMKILGKKFEIANIEIPIALPPFDDTIRLDAVTMSFERPAPPPDPETTGTSEGDSHGNSSSDTDTPTTSDTSTSDTRDDSSSSDAASDTASDADGDTAGAATPDGCACDLETRSPAPLLALLLLALPRRRPR